MKPTFFATPALFRAWLRAHHGKSKELLVGFRTLSSGKPSLTWPQSVDEALCYGWIDGVRKRIDENAYTIRFTPRRAGGIWSAVNVKRARELIAQERMHSAGLQAFEARRANPSGAYSYETRPSELPALYAKTLAQKVRAQRFFDAQPPSYRRAAIWWVVSAKQETTRLKRLKTLVEHCKSSQRLPQFSPRRASRD